jgi:hypothetical protein
VVKVARESANTLVFRKATLRFRVRPGDDTAGALGRIPYVLEAGIAKVAGLTRPDGSVTLRVPAGGEARLQIFGSTYEIALAGPFPPIETPEGLRRRLSRLGYRGDLEAAVLDFQADQGIEPRGMDASGGVDAATKGRLEELAGA